MPTSGKRKPSAADALNPAPAKKAATGKNKSKNTGKENRRPEHADAPTTNQPSATANAATASAHVAAANTNGTTAVTAHSTANAGPPDIDPTLLLGSVNSLQDQLRDALAEITKLKAGTAMGTVPAVVKKVKKIPRPETGSAGHGFNLQEKMGLANNKEKYDAILRTIRSIVQQANLDHKDTWHHQDKELVGRCMRLARQRQPYLKRFYRDWATEEYIKVHLKNKRHYEKRRDKKKKAAGMVDEGVDDGDDDDDDGDDDDDTEESSEESGEGEESGGEELRAIADD